MIRSIFLAALLWCWFSMLPAGAAAPCGEESPCTVDGGRYYFVAPASRDRPSPVLLFFHGWGSSGRAVIDNKSIREPALLRGYVLVAPDGMVPPGRENRGWSHQGSPQQLRDEVAFVRRVIDDVAARVAIDRKRVLVSGFSQGGSMVWHLACFDRAAYAAFAPVAGAFWEPMPQACSGGGLDLLHLHGYADRVVPLEGRAIGERWHQADLFAGMATLRQAAGCRSEPDAIRIANGYRCRQWSSCASDGKIELCLHDGGHVLPGGWLAGVLDRFARAGQLAGGDEDLP